MEQNLAVVLVFISSLIAATVLIIALLNFRIRKRLIRERLMDDQTVKALNRLQYHFRIDALKWGLLLFSGGIGLVALHFIPCKTDSPLPYGIELLFLSAGFLAYYRISRSDRRN